MAAKTDEAIHGGTTRASNEWLGGVRSSGCRASGRGGVGRAADLDANSQENGAIAQVSRRRFHLFSFF